MSEDVYVRERTTLIEMEQKSADQHDKAILTLASGALGLSIAFLDKIAPHPLENTLPLVGLAWLFFIFSIICIVASFLTSQAACQRQRELLDAEYATGLIGEELNRPAKLTSRLNVGSYVLSVAGAAFLTIFAWANLSGDQKTMSQLPTLQKAKLTNGTDRHTINEPSRPQKPEERGTVPPKRPAAPPAPSTTQPKK